MDHYAVIGHPINHSRSPLIHRLFAEQTGQDICYEALLGPLEGCDDFIRQFFRQHGRGCNITVPFKELAFQLAEHKTPRAQLAGAVNTLRLNDDGSLLGDNTDGAGLVEDLRRLQFPLQGARILLLGAGGAARGALHPLLEQHPASLTIANRTLARAQALVAMSADCGVTVSAADYARLVDAEFDLIINATASGIQGDVPPLAASVIGAQTACYDMYYSRELTPFLAFAAEAGAQQLADGIGMLVGQAAHAFYLWRGIMPEILPVITQLRQRV